MLASGGGCWRAPDGVGSAGPPGAGVGAAGPLAVEMIADTGKLSSMELVEADPTLDDQDQTPEPSPLGKRIL